MDVSFACSLVCLFVLFFVFFQLGKFPKVFTKIKPVMNWMVTTKVSDRFHYRFLQVQIEQKHEQKT